MLKQRYSVTITPDKYIKMSHVVITLGRRKLITTLDAGIKANDPQITKLKRQLDPDYIKIPKPRL